MTRPRSNSRSNLRPYLRSTWQRSKWLALWPIFGLTSAAFATDTPAPNPAPDYASEELEAARTTIAHYQQFNQRLQDVGWKLVRGNAAFCERAIPSIGLQLQDAASFGDPAFVRAALGMRGDFAVQTVASGSPADLSGQFLPNREIARIADVNPNQWPGGERLHWQRAIRAHDWIDRALQSKGSITFGFADGENIALEPVSVCATRFELLSNEDLAKADGQTVFLGIEFEGFSYEEEIFAGVVAHELAHNLLGHRAWLKENKRKQPNVRRVEREADRLMPWLLANAGYDPAAAMRFFEVVRPSSGSVLFIPGTHDKWKNRVALVRGELALVNQLLDREGKADWSVHFERDSALESEPDLARQD